jgi:hypothetical protein
MFDNYVAVYEGPGQTGKQWLIHNHWIHEKTGKILKKHID